MTSSEPATDTPDPASVVATLRMRIVNGSFPAGMRLAEIPIAESLGVSRTPVRLALRTLAQEGLLEQAGARGFAVRAFSEADVRCAVEVRGVLEGLAARALAERGLSEAVRATLHRCLAEGERVLADGRLTAADIAAWSHLNAEFHHTIVDAGDSHIIADAIARNNHLPFASADSITFDAHHAEQDHARLRVAQLHHQLVVDAMERREAGRAESLMREHAQIGLRYGQFLRG